MLITIQKSFFVKQIVLIFALFRAVFLSNILNLKNAKHFKKMISEVLMSVVWHAKRWCKFCVSEDEKKKIKAIFTEAF